jgi:hypothetical protein
MNSRQFQAKAVLQSHGLVVEEFLSTGDSSEIDMEVASDLARSAAHLSHQLTIVWEASMIWLQARQDNPESNVRENSTTGLCQPFVVSPGIVPSCGDHHADTSSETIPCLVQQQAKVGAINAETRKVEAWARSINRGVWVDMAAFEIGGSAHLVTLPKRRGTRATY